MHFDADIPCDPAMAISQLFINQAGGWWHYPRQGWRATEGLEVGCWSGQVRPHRALSQWIYGISLWMAWRHLSNIMPLAIHDILYIRIYIYTYYIYILYLHVYIYNYIYTHIEYMCIYIIILWWYIYITICTYMYPLLPYFFSQKLLKKDPS